MSGPSDTRHTEAVIFDPLAALSHYRPDFQPEDQRADKAQRCHPHHDRRQPTQGSRPTKNGELAHDQWIVAIEERQRGAR